MSDSGQQPYGDQPYGDQPSQQGQPGQQPQYGQPQYGQPQYGQPQYGGGGGYGGGYGGYGGGPSGPPPPNYLVWAILSTIFCCLPLGIASIVFAAQVNGKWQAGDAAGAQDSSRKARQFAIWAAVAGVIVGILYAVLIGAGVMSSNRA